MPENQSQTDSCAVKSTSADRIVEIPQWGNPSDWLEANDTVQYLVGRYRSQLSTAETAGVAIEDALERVFPLMDQLCSSTCGHCLSPCCLKATVWYDFRDLLFLHLTDQEIPSMQLIGQRGDTCRYSSTEGCLIPRMTRAWVCTLYLCPDQMALLRRHGHKPYQFVLELLNEIKANRILIEQEFLRVTCPSR